MREASIIPLLPFGNTAFPFKIETIQSLLTNAYETNATVYSNNYYEIVWLFKGTGSLHIDLREFQIGNGSIFCIRPNQAHRLDISPDMEGYVFSFTESFFNSVEQGYDWTTDASVIQIVTPSSQIRIGSDAFSMKEIVTLMVKEYESPLALRINLLRRYFSIFLLYLLREIEVPSKMVQQSRESNLIRAFMEMIDKNFKEKKMVADYAENLCVTPNYLNRVIKRSTGFSARYHIKQRLLLEAKRLGRYSNVGMKQIAYSLGFCDSAHFSKFFKSGAGTNFTDFKNLDDIAMIPTSFHRA